jgi:glutaredoxin 3
MTAAVEIFTKFACPYCYRAKALLDRKQVHYVEYDIGGDAGNRAEMLRRAPDARTVPQIFIGGVAVGGSDDLHALEQSGNLDMMLAA